MAALIACNERVLPTSKVIPIPGKTTKPLRATVGMTLYSDALFKKSTPIFRVYADIIH